MPDPKSARIVHSSKCEYPLIDLKGALRVPILVKRNVDNGFIYLQNFYNLVSVLAKHDRANVTVTKVGRELPY